VRTSTLLRAWMDIAGEMEMTASEQASVLASTCLFSAITSCVPASAPWADVRPAPPPAAAISACSDRHAGWCRHSRRRCRPLGDLTTTDMLPPPQGEVGRNPPSSVLGWGRAGALCATVRISRTDRPCVSGEHGDAKLNEHQSAVQVACGECCLPLDERSDLPIKDRQPSPRCVTVGRYFDAQLQDEVGLTSRMAAHKWDKSGSPEGEAVRVSGPGERVAAVDFAPDGSVPSQIAGPAPRGEEGSLETAQLLVHRLRQSGENWDDPVTVDRQDVDCEARSGDQVLPIQVTRVSRARFWENLGRVGRATEQGTADQAGDELMNAIAAKARQLPGVQKATLVLALDARDTPGFALRGVVSRFRQRHGHQAAALGFRGVWVIGPTVDLVARLDR
jgi:hypothetical protein